MPNRRKLNIAMVGYGFMGRAHSNAFHQAGHFFDLPFELGLKVICGRNKEKLQQTATQWGWEQTATDWQSVVGRPDIDIVDICTPNSLHAPIAIAAACADKIVMCEKPLANSVEQAERMAEAARGVPTLVWFNYRRVPAVRLAHQLISEGRIGDVFHYRGFYLQSWGRSPNDPGAWRFHPEEAGSGASGDLLSHSLDLATWLNGPVRRLCSSVHTFYPGRKVDDAVILLAEFSNGSIATFEASRFATGNQNRNAFEVNGSQGSLAFNLEEMNHLQFSDFSDESALQGFRKILVTGLGHAYVDHVWPPGHVIGYEHTFIFTLVDFLNALSSGNRFHPDFSDALATQRLLEAVAESGSRRLWVDVDHAETTTKAGSQR
ncbi:MAG TPA: Gfo/Idh/MocA family oxidoreductase [Alloacidobacterium sp.]|jgi:myo-inositol 2-dehydrogenase/D-chiro-inositol 1-dehydrogenase|nr:Gfo/Idh/MocA family oxidoreductase [Alloacidobacterium sp.]